MKKKLLIISLFVIICAAFAFADAYKDVNNYINQGLSDQNVIKIKELAPELTQQQKESIYRWRKVDTVFPFLENTFLGFGSGSFSQGDSTHGIIFLAGDTLCLGLVGYNIISNGWENFINGITGKGGSKDDMTLAKIALIGALGLRVYQAIRPFTYAKNYNAKLKDAIGLETKVALVPTSKDGVGMAVSAKVSY
jgi:hypothetical protein